MCEEGDVRLFDLIDLFDEYGKEEIMDAFQSTYGSHSINAMILTKIVEELREMRTNLGPDYSISEIRPKDHTSLLHGSCAEEMDEKMIEIMEELRIFVWS